MDSSKIKVYCAISLDGFLAGPDDDLSWLDAFSEPDASNDPGTVAFETFMASTGAMLMGRRTYDVLMSFQDVPWPYGDTPILVATRRPLENARDSVMTESGSISELCAAAKKRADGKHVYLDGGGIISQALDAKLVDELIVTVAPMLLGRGIPVYKGQSRHGFSATILGKMGAMPQFRLTPSA